MLRGSRRRNSFHISISHLVLTYLHGLLLDYGDLNFLCKLLANKLDGPWVKCMNA